MASLTAPSGYDRVWSSNLALTQGRCFRWLGSRTASSKLASGVAAGIRHVCWPSGTYSGGARGAADQRSHDPCQSSRLSTPGLPERSM